MTSAPFRGLSDQLVVISLTGSPAPSATRPSALKTVGSGAFGNDNRIAQLEAELSVLLEAVARLEDGRVRVHAVEIGDVPVGAVVEAAVDADRPVDPMHHPAATAGEAPQSPVIEVERVEEAGRRLTGDAVDLHVEPALPELAHEPCEKLVPAPRRRRSELVKDGDVGTIAARSETRRLGSRCPAHGTPAAAGVHVRGAWCGAESHDEK